MNILFPANYFKKSEPDETFEDQWLEFKNYDFSVHTMLMEELPDEPKITPPLSNSESILYRGYMLSPEEYRIFYDYVSSFGNKLITSPENYSRCHHLPNWYPLIRDYTPETLIFDKIEEAEKAITQLDWNGFFIKDYVKSLKTSVGSKIFDPSLFSQVINEMEKFRGNIEGGICIRKIEDLVPETELRIFVYNGKPYSNQKEIPIPDFIDKIIDSISVPFFSIDIIQNSLSEFRVVEIGDGQVSDIVGWTAKEFVEIFNHNA